jgi:arabinofuranan 3-O-arabinosyltransferase
LTDALRKLGAGLKSYPELARPLGIFAPWRLQAYGYTLAVFYAFLLLGFYKAGAWLVDSRGVPVDSDFIREWIAGFQALHGDTAQLYNAAEFVKLQAALMSSGADFYPIWSYPPTFLLLLAPFALLPYVVAFLTWDFVSLFGCVAVAYLITRRLQAIAVVLALPYVAWNFLCGQNGFVTATLLGSSLYILDRRPMLAGSIIACLAYKPHFGILIPVALAAGSQWRAFASAVATTMVLAGFTIIAFGADGWAEFVRRLAAQAEAYYFVDPDGASGPNPGLQTVYGLVLALHVSPGLAVLTQGVATATSAVIVWVSWRSAARYSLKAATLSAAALVATPYAFPYDMVMIVIPVAFLVRDQMRYGLVRGEQTSIIGLFGASFVVVAFAWTALGALVMITLLGLILRRAVLSVEELAPLAVTISLEARAHE